MNAAIKEIADLIGSEQLSRDEDARALFCEDIAGPSDGQMSVVIVPDCPQILAQAIEIAFRNGLPVVPRGGGMSYTGGYAADAPQGLGIDLTSLNRIEAIDTEARTVTVECGCTWSRLAEELSDQGWRTPFFGPLSGIAATVGGALSQNASFFGSASGGYAADSLIGLEIVDGTGRLHRIGSWGAGRHAGLRYFGPDLVGLFVGDCGAFGIKTRAVLRIEPIPSAVRYLAFSFERDEDIVGAMAALADLPHLSETWALDRQAHQNLSRSGFNTLETVSITSEIASGSASVVDAVRNLASASRLRRVTLKDLAWSLNIVVEAPMAEISAAIVSEVERIAIGHNGEAIPDTIPRVTRAKPFRRIKALVGPDGERWLPCHGIAPAGKARDAFQRVKATLEKRRSDMSEAGITATVLLAAVAGDIIIEPQLLWPDSLSGFQKAHATADQVSAFTGTPDNPQGRALAREIRESLTNVLATTGCAHLQIGRHYRYFDDLDEGMRCLLQSSKRVLDPAGILNPGVLGLPAEV